MPERKSLMAAKFKGRTKKLVHDFERRSEVSIEEISFKNPKQAQ